MLKQFLIKYLFFFFSLNLIFLLVSILLYSPSSFFILIPSYICSIFFSYMSSNMSHLYSIGQFSTPSDSSFLNVMMNEDFWGFLSYFDQLSNIKCKCIRQIIVNLSGSFRRHPRIAPYVLEFFLRSSKFTLTLLAR